MRMALCLVLLGACEFSTSGVEGVRFDASAGDPVDSAVVDPFGTGRDGDLTITEPTVINAYAAVVEGFDVGAIAVPVDSIVGFAAGDLVLLHHATGVLATSGEPTPIDLATAGVGAVELVRLVDVQPGELTLERPSEHAFGASSQVVRVPEFASLTVARGGRIEAPAWDGRVGGVIAALVRDAATLDGDVVADGLGFPGGAAGSNGAFFGCSGLDGTSDGGGGGRKGSGVAIGDAHGRGNLGNGAGGGNCHNAGGGGGGNAGTGGAGGATWAATEPYGGLGGAAVVIDASHAVFGGGGGAGEDNAGDGDDDDGEGGAGGGLVVLRAGTIVGEGRISANGANGGASRADGAGGAGAGGTILIVTRDVLDVREVRARGGKGGASDGAGSGGGGGGGWIAIDAPSIGAPLHVDAGAGDKKANDGADGANGRTLLP